MINVLLSNDYPLDFIFSTINNRIKTLLRKKDLYTNIIKNINDPNNNNPKNYFMIHAKFQKILNRWPKRIISKLIIHEHIKIDH